MKLKKKEIALVVALSFAPALLGLALWDKLPEQMPIHWGVNGQADDYGSRAFVVFGMPGLLALLALVVAAALSTDPKREGQPRVMQRLGLWTVPAVSWVVMSISFFVALGAELNVTRITLLLVAVLFIAIGNYLPKCRPSYTMGIRTPWALNDEDNWRYTHRIGGFCFVAGGIVAIVAALLDLVWLCLAALLLPGCIPVAASYLYDKKHGGDAP